MIWVPHGSAKTLDGTINMMGMEPFVVFADFDRNFQEEYTIADRTPEQHRNLAATQPVQNLQCGTRTILAVRVILNDGSYNVASQTGLCNDIFGNGVNLVYLKSQFAYYSYNKLIFNKGPNRLMLSNPNDGTMAINNGVFDIRVNINCSAGEDNIVNAVTAKINSVFGVSNPNVLANHVMYYLPSGGSVGVALVNGGLSWHSNQWCNKVSVQIHEVSLVHQVKLSTLAL
jgi:hypothetical protein